MPSFHSWEDKGVHAFPECICLKVNVIARLEFGITYYDSAVQRFYNYEDPTFVSEILCSGIQAYSPRQSQTDIFHFCFDSYENNIYYFNRFNSCVHRFSKHCVWEYVGQGKITHFRRGWCLFERWHKKSCKLSWLFWLCFFLLLSLSLLLLVETQRFVRCILRPSSGPLFIW